MGRASAVALAGAGRGDGVGRGRAPCCTRSRTGRCARAPMPLWAWGWTMRAEPLVHRCAALLLWAALLTSGCVTLAPQPGAGTSEGPRALSTLREAGEQE